MTLSQDTLSEFAAAARAKIDDAPQMNESTVQVAIVTEFLNTLGWEIPTDGQLEYSFQSGTGTNRVDYAFFHKGSPQLFVEVKGCDTSLDDGHRSQLRSYLIQENADWGILTNGKEIELYHRRINNGDSVVHQLQAINIDELPAHTELFEAVTRDAITAGKSSEIAERIQQLQAARSELEENKATIAEDITETLVDDVGEVVRRPAEEQAKELIDALADELAEMSLTSFTQSPSGQPSGFRDRLQAHTGVEVTDTEVHLQENQTARDQLRAVIQFMFSEGYITRENLPVEAGEKRYLLNSEPVHQDGSEMVFSDEVVDGVYAELNYSTDQICRRIQDLVTHTKDS